MEKVGGGVRVDGAGKVDGEGKATLDILKII